MLTRRAKAYSSSCSQTVNLSPVISSQFILGLCTAAEDRKNQFLKTLILEAQGLSKSSMLIRLKSSSLVLVVTGYRFLMPSCAGFFEPRKSRLRPSKFTFNFENFVCSFSMSISIDFGAIRFKNVSRSPKSLKIHKNLYFGVQGHPRSLNSLAIKSECTTSY